MSIELLQRLGVFVQPSLLELALTHSSFAYENKCGSNERLEFLGDSILGYLVASHVFDQNHDLSEAVLTRLKNSIVSAEALATAAIRIDLGKYLRLGKGEESSGGRNKLNILADAMEALIAAAYLSGGIESANTIVKNRIVPMLGDPQVLMEFADPKTTLTQKLTKLSFEPPKYVVSFTGPEHNLQYKAKCFSADRLLGIGEGRTIRSAETAAAAAALAELRQP
jgi:ribonuclease-3